MKWLIYLLLGLFLFFSFYLPIEIEDIWWHLATGRWITENAQFPAVDIFSPIADRAPWILTQGGGSVFYYLIYDNLGYEGLKVSRFIIFGLIVFVFILFAAKRIPASLNILLSTLLIFALQTRVLLRPFVFNFIFIQIYLIILLGHQKKREDKGIYLLPLLTILWNQLHAGGFVYGTLLIGLFWFSSFISLVQKRNLFTKENQFGVLSLILILHGGAFILNPRGLEGALYPIKGLLFAEYLSSSVLELSSPIYLLSVKGIWAAVLFVFAAWTLMKNEKRRLSEVLLFIVSVAMFLISRRGSVFFALSCCYVIAENWQASSFRKDQRKVFSFAVNMAMVIFLSGAIYFQATSKVWRDGKAAFRFQETFDPYVPKRAWDLIHENGWEGPIYNWDGYGGFLIWKGYPQIKPMNDTRQINPEIFADNLKVQKNPDRFWPLFERKYQWTMALIDANFGNQGRILDYLKDHPKWQLVSVKGASVLFVKRGAFDLSPQLEFYEKILRNTPPVPSAQIRSFLENRGAKKRNLFERFYYIEDLEEAVALYQYGFREAALQKLIAVNKQISDPKVQEILSLMAQD